VPLQLPEVFCDKRISNNENNVYVTLAHSSTVHVSNVGTILQPFETMEQQCCNALLR